MQQPSPVTTSCETAPHVPVTGRSAYRDAVSLPLRQAGPLLLAVLRRPRLWITAARQARALVPTRWWRQRPFLPLPSAAYLELRAITQYGDPRRAPEVDDVVAYLQWLRQWRAASAVQR